MLKRQLYSVSHPVCLSEKRIRLFSYIIRKTYTYVCCVYHVYEVLRYSVCISATIGFSILVFIISTPDTRTFLLKSSLFWWNSIIYSNDIFHVINDKINNHEICYRFHLLWFQWKTTEWFSSTTMRLMRHGQNGASHIFNFNIEWRIYRLWFEIAHLLLQGPAIEPIWQWNEYECCRYSAVKILALEKWNFDHVQDWLRQSILNRSDIFQFVLSSLWINNNNSKKNMADENVFSFQVCTKEIVDRS